MLSPPQDLLAVNTNQGETMIDKSSGSSGEFTTVIGADAVFKGELSFEKGVRVDGRIEGRITTKGHLAVSTGGRLQADVVASNIIVEGEVHGNLTATDRVELRKTARLQGDICAAKLLVAEGACFTGQCAVGPDAKAPAAPSASTGAAAAPNRLTQKDVAPRK